MCFERHDQYLGLSNKSTTAYSGCAKGQQSCSSAVAVHMLHWCQKWPCWSCETAFVHLTRAETSFWPFSDCYFLQGQLTFVTGSAKRSLTLARVKLIWIPSRCEPSGRAEGERHEETLSASSSLREPTDESTHY